MNSQPVMGGEFQIDPILLTQNVNNNYVEDILKKGYIKLYSTGRTALYIILQTIKKLTGGGILLPDYICETVTKAVRDSGTAYEFYHVDGQMKPDIEAIDKIISKQFSSIVLTNYFGMLDLSYEISAIRKRYPWVRIILDDVQNAYGCGKELDYDFAFTSLRKWFPIPDGAIVVIKDRKIAKQFEDLDSVNLFAEYKLSGNLLKNYRTYVKDELCLSLLTKGENLLNTGYLCKYSNASAQIIGALDYDNIAAKRKENALYLHTQLEEMKIKHLFKKDAVPLFVPVLFEKGRNHIRKELFKHNIFCPAHWPWINATLNGKNRLYEEELSLICDQRYKKEDMDRMLEVIRYAIKYI